MFIESLFSSRRAVPLFITSHFRLMSWFNSLINSFPISLSERLSVLSVCVKKSICVFCVEEEQIRLTLFSRNASDRSFAPLSLIWFLVEMECVECLCEKVDLCLLGGRRENSTHCVVWKCTRQIFCSFISNLISKRDLIRWVSVWKSRSVSFGWKKEKIGPTLFSRNASARSFAPLSPIGFSVRLSVLSVCVKKSIRVFCVEEEKIRLTLFTRNASARSFAPLSPILFLSRRR